MCHMLGPIGCGTRSASTSFPKSFRMSRRLVVGARSPGESTYSNGIRAARRSATW